MKAAAIEIGKRALICNHETLKTESGCIKEDQLVNDQDDAEN